MLPWVRLELINTFFILLTTLMINLTEYAYLQSVADIKSVVYDHFH